MTPRRCCQSSRPPARSCFALFGALGSLVGLWACDDGAAAKEAQRYIQQAHFGRIVHLVREDVERHRRGLAYAADRIAAGFVRAKPERQEREMRQALRLIRNPKRGVPELVISPMSFMAAVNRNGVVVARDAEPDKMRGMNLAALFPEVREALAGKAAFGIGEFENAAPQRPSSVTVLIVAPAHFEGRVVGALVAGIPLWRLSQRLSKQLQLEAGHRDLVLWVYLYRSERLFHHGTPPDLDSLVPDFAARRAGYRRSPGGFTGSMQQFGYTYGYGVRPLRFLGPDVGFIVFRMDPDA